ncbi:EEF1A lysine methyltransferase 1 [Vanrija pseudolonga]|uniref:EEF1A lysine methyltransferase 1 n=1 Tax=Vanrija pseudolonga TaxID=143232 RepID=A0AAF0YCY8_9TREE|nr:EEF1A lysine methyltransferase 1 [Vanrija pseudolonga]
MTIENRPAPAADEADKHAAAYDPRDDISEFSDLSDAELDVGLSADALAALQDFYTEQQATQDALDSLADLLQRTDVDSDDETPAPVTPEDLPLSMDLFPEEWGMSQFWNDEASAAALAAEAAVQAGPDGLIVAISSPSTFLALKKLRVPNPLLLLEFDPRFAVCDEFRRYDVHDPLDLPGLDSVRGTAAVIIADPPYLNAATMGNTAKTMNALAGEDCKFIVATGWVVRDTIKSTLNARITAYRPHHRGGLANAFRTYLNYTSADPAFAFADDEDDGDNDFADDVAARKPQIGMIVPDVPELRSA